MGAQLFANGASALLAASINDTDTTIQVAVGFGALFPNPGAGEFFVVTLEDQSGNKERIKIESRSTDLLTVATGGRGWDGSTAQSWTNGVTRVECRVTKGTLEGFVQKSGDAMSGDLDMNGNEIQDADLTGTATKIRAGQIVNVPLRGVVDDDSNEVRVPTDGSRATAGGDPILTEADNLFTENFVFPSGMIMMWYGLLASIPSGWVVCDGTNGTPDLRDRVPIGAGSTYALNDSGGSATASGNTGSGGGHTPTGAVDSHVLTEAELPEHRHFVSSNAAYSGSGDQNVSASNQLYRSTDGGPGGDTQYILRGTATDASVGRSSAVGSGSGHSHGLTMDAVAAHTHSLSSINTLPPYRAVYFIMKT